MSLINNSAITVDILCEFLEVAIHNILYIRKVYPEGIFTKAKKYGVLVYKAVHPQVNEYISEILKAVHFHAKRNNLKQISVCIINDSGKSYEQFIFNIMNLQNSSLKVDPIFIKLECYMRDFCLELHNLSRHLRNLPEDVSFRILLHTTEHSVLSFNDNPAFENFPWIHVSDESKPVNNIVPLYTIGLDNLTLQMYIEKYA